MLNQLKTLLSDAQLRQQVKASNSLADAISLLKTAGADKGYLFSRDRLSQFLQSPLERLDESELLLVSGGWSGSPRCLEGEA